MSDVNFTTNIPETQTVTIPLTKGYSAIVDNEDADLADFKWYTYVGKHTCYAMRKKRVTKRQSTVLLHQVILTRMLGRDLVKGEMCDHQDGNGLNNTRTNLRLATKAENMRNQRLSQANTSGYKGVSWDKYREKWRAYIMPNKKQRFLGHFDTPEEAHAAYCAAALELFGEFANFGLSSQD